MEHNTPLLRLIKSGGIGAGTCHSTSCLRPSTQSVPPPTASLPSAALVGSVAELAVEELGAEASSAEGTDLPRPTFELNACCAAFRSTCSNGSTTFANTFQSVCGSPAFWCSIGLSARSNAIFAVIAQEVVVAVGVVRVVVKLPIAGPAVVRIVRAGVFWIGSHIGCLATRLSNAAFC